MKIMKNSIKLCLIAMMMFSMSCSNEPITDAINSSQDVDNFSKATKSSVAISEKPGGFPDGDFLEISGASSTLLRNKNGITVNFNTNGLIPGNAYTLWWVVFGETPGPPTVSFAAGHIAGDSGEGVFSARLNAGSDFNNPLTAQAHMVLKSHGAAVPGIIDEQIHTEGGGCTFSEESGPGRIWPDSDEVGRCADIQLAIHPPVN